MADTPMKLPEIGAPAPAFRLVTAAGNEVALGDYRGVKRVVLWFSKGLF
jgi:peroxiredoxin